MAYATPPTPTDNKADHGPRTMGHQNVRHAGTHGPGSTVNCRARAMSHSDPLLSVRDLKTYFLMDEGVVKAVDGVSFDVRAGQIFGIVGESGCGKSVTVKSILRIVEVPGKIVHGQIVLRRLRPDGTSAEEEVDLVGLD